MVVVKDLTPEQLCNHGKQCRVFFPLCSSALSIKHEVVVPLPRLCPENVCHLKNQDF